jgi:VWFA-related protein
MIRYQDFLIKQRWAEAGLSLLVSLAVFLAAIPGQSQDKKQTQSSSDQEDVIKITSNLVSIDVLVKDKKGKAVTDLKAEDFTVYENGVQQKIEFFDSTLSGSSEAVTPAKAPEAIVTSTQPTGRSPNGLPRNIVCLVLDGQSTELANLKRVRQGIIKYIRERLTASDSVALFSISSGLQLLQPFTQDKGRLIAAVEKASDSSTVSKTSELRDINASIATLRDQPAGPPMASVNSQSGAAPAGSAAAEAMIAQRMLEQYLQMRSVLTVQQTRPVLAALAAICEGLRTIPGKKTLVMFSQGFIAPQALDWQVQSTIDIANRANVAIYIIDAVGLTGGTPKSGGVVPPSGLDAISAMNSQESRMRAAAGESIFDIARNEGLNREQDLLYRISGDTGGQFIKNTNDISSGLNRIDAEIRSRYTLAYRTTDTNFDGAFRKIKIEVSRPDANVIGRNGYYAIPPNQIVPLSPEDKKLMTNFASLAAHSTLPLSIQLTGFRSQPGYYIVPLSFEIPPRAVEFARKGDQQRLQLDVLGVVRNEGDDKILSRLGGNFDIGLTAKQYAAILNDKIFYRQDLELEAGTYIIDLVVKDRLSGKIAARREKLSLPVTDTEFWVTEPALSRHAEPLRQSAATDVFTEGNVQIRPSPSREFHPGDNLIIFFKLYNAAVARETGKPLVRVTVTIMKDGKMARKPLDYELTDPVNEPVLHLTFARYLKLEGLAVGRYLALIESRDMVQQKVLTQEVPFEITPQ